MNQFRRIIQSNIAFFIPYMMILIAMTFLFLFIPKNSLHLLINKYHSPAADFSFTYLTYLGDGLTPFIIATIFLFFSVRSAIKISVAGSLAGLIAQFFKRMLFPGIQRPYAILKELPGFHLVEGVNMHTSFSFPSGHSATIFAICLIIAVGTENKLLKFIMLLVSVIVGFSRVYLSQHHLIDMYAGSLIGILSALLVILLIDQRKAKWLDSSLLKVPKKAFPSE